MRQHFKTVSGDIPISFGLLENPQRLGKFNIFGGGSVAEEESTTKDILITKLGILYYQYGIV